MRAKGGVGKTLPSEREINDEMRELRVANIPMCDCKTRPQISVSCEPTLPELVDVPTGMGKTAMAMLGWLWRRRFYPDKLVASMGDDGGIEGRTA